MATLKALADDNFVNFSMMITGMVENAGCVCIEIIKVRAARDCIRKEGESAFLVNISL